MRISAAFSAAMDRLGPFEPAPELAVAVSGGPDSMALAVLAHGWARRRRGRVVALVVDHGLRPEARAEARLTRRRLDDLGIPSRLLVWRGEKPATAIQAAARAARYALLEGWCARAGVLHLLTAHQRDDQAETVFMRRERHSGPEGLAGIAAVVEREHVRVLRPLLDVPRAGLQAFLRARCVAWIDDPSNANPVFARSRVRAALAAQPGAGTATLIRDARRAARSRTKLEARCARLLGRKAALFPQGFARIPRAALAAAAAPVARHAVARLLACVGGGVWPPAGAALDALLGALRAPGPFPGRTLAGCRLVPDGDGLLIVREVRGADRPVRVAPGGRFAWDRRFRLALAPRGRASRRLAVAALGAEGWAELVGHRPALRGAAVPPPARLALPALRDRAGVVCVPHLGYGRASRKAASLMCDLIIFRPARSLCAAEFPVV